MGNNNSKGSGSSPSSTTTSPVATHSDNPLARRTSRRRESVQGLPTTKVTVLPPTASLESAQGESVRHGSRSSNRSRGRSSTSTAPSLKRQDSEPLSQSTSAAASFRSAAVPIRSRSPVDPIDIPYQATGAPATGSPHSASPSHYTQSHTHFGRPPRLPLPIEEEVLIPGSPIISPADLSTSLKAADVEGDLPRPGSGLSSTTVEDEEAGDDLHPNDVDIVGPLVDTLFEW